MTPAESYLADLYAVRGAGTPETSGYPVLASFLNEIGGSLKSKITTVIHPANSGAGLPDGRFFSAKEPGAGDVRTSARGPGFVDFHLNATTRWREVPAEAWAYAGRLSGAEEVAELPRSRSVRRPLTPDEALDFTKNVRRITALIELRPQLDAHYRASIST